MVTPLGEKTKATLTKMCLRRLSAMEATIAACKSIYCNFCTVCVIETGIRFARSLWFVFALLCLDFTEPIFRLCSCKQNSVKKNRLTVMKRKAMILSSKLKRRRKNKDDIHQYIRRDKNSSTTISSATNLTSTTTTNFIFTVIGELSDNVLVKIFSYLSAQQRIRIERVCKRWNQISKSSWTKFNVINYSTFTPDLPVSIQVWPVCWRRPVLNNQTLKAILFRCGKYLKFLDLSGYRDTLDYRVLSVVGQYCPNLETINLTGILVTNSSLRSLALRCFKLKSVIFQRCFQDSIIDRGLSYLLSNCPELISLNLSENERITGNCFHDLPPRLRFLVLSTCYELQDEGVRVK